MWNSTSEKLGAVLESLASESKAEVFWVAPFITRKAFQTLLSKIDLQVDATIVTRWNPGDLLAGVSDPDIWLDTRARSNTKIVLVSRLHAKYFRFDSRVIMGSANITETALQYRSPSNIELLTEVDQNESLNSLETFLIDQGITVTQSIYEEVSQLKKSLVNTRSSPLKGTERPPNKMNTAGTENWLPAVRQPDSLWLTYSNQTNSVSTAERDRAVQDLEFLEVFPGLDKESFEAAVSISLIQMPLIVEIDEILIECQRFGAMRDFVASKLPNADRDPSEAWQATMRWLLYFLPHRYHRFVPNHSEIIVRLDERSVHLSDSPTEDHEPN